MKLIFCYKYQVGVASVTSHSTTSNAVETVTSSSLTFPDPESLSPVEKAKRLASHRAVDEHFPEHAKVVGIGSGSTVVYAVERILQRKDLKDIIFIPTGFQSKELIVNGGLRLGEISGYPVLDVAFDGADEVDSALNCIKGGGACLFQEKLVASCAKKFILVADYRKNSSILGKEWTQGVPIEVVPLAQASVLRILSNMGAQNPQLRMGGKAKAGPIITDNGNFIIDAHFGQIPVELVRQLAAEIKAIVGVVEVGLFVDMADAAYFGNDDGSVSVRGKSDGQDKNDIGKAE
ncbi:ribose-5-phosphate isomerase rki1 [Saitoella coloradoensis]